jgi:predicted alpha/beta-hydrolase family hydrolase
LKPETTTIVVSDGVQVSGLVLAPSRPKACLVLAHGAGAGMTHPFMAKVAEGLADRPVATLRYQFPYMERGGKRPDPPKLAHTTVRAAVTEAGRRWPDVPLIAAAPLPGVRGLAFFGFPLHPPKQPSRERGRHLFDVQLPMLFLQGTRDALASLDELEPLCQELGQHATLRLFDDADHSFHVPTKSGHTDAEVMSAMLDAFVTWTDETI